MSNVVNLRRSTELPDEWYEVNCPVDYDLDGPARHVVIGDAVPARALVLRNQSLRLFSLRASVTIAAISVLWFGGQLIRGWLS